MTRKIRFSIILLAIILLLSCKKSGIQTTAKKPWSEYVIKSAEIELKEGYYQYSNEFIKKHGMEKLKEPLYFQVKEAFAYKIFLAIPNYQTETIVYYFFEDTDWDNVNMDFVNLAKLDDKEMTELLDKRIILLCVNDHEWLNKDKYCKTDPDRYYFQLTPEGAILPINLKNVKDDLNDIQRLADL